MNLEESIEALRIAAQRYFDIDGDEEAEVEITLTFHGGTVEIPRTEPDLPNLVLTPQWKCVAGWTGADELDDLKRIRTDETVSSPGPTILAAVTNCLLFIRDLISQRQDLDCAFLDNQPPTLKSVP